MRIAADEAGLETLDGAAVLAAGVVGAEAVTGETGEAETPSLLASVLVPEADRALCKFVVPRVGFAIPDTVAMGVA